MSKSLFLTAVLFVAGAPALTLASELSAGHAMYAQKMELTPLAFTQNQGQWDGRVLFRANAGGVTGVWAGATMWFTTEGVTYQFTRGVPSGVETAAGRVDDPFGRLSHPNSATETQVIKASFVGANPNPEIVGEELLEYRCNYFLGENPTNWRTDVPNHRAIVYKEIYPGIDLKYYGAGDGKMEYDFIVQPGADQGQIAIRYDGAKEICVDENGQLVVETEWGTVVERQPVVYQVDGDRKIAIAGEYLLLDESIFGFRLGDTYQPELALVIDPVLTYSAHLGGEFGVNSLGGGIAVDAIGDTYISGSTRSSDFPTLNPYQQYQGLLDSGFLDVFVSKFSRTGDALIYSTYLGGLRNDVSSDIAVDAGGAAYLTGWTTSTDFPTQNPYQTASDLPTQNYKQSNPDTADIHVFVTKLASSGNVLMYSTYLGGGESESGNAIAVDASGSAIVTGVTSSFDFPTQNAFQTDQGGVDGFVTKFSPSGDAVLFSTYLGGGLADQANDVALDASGDAYLTGWTYSTDFPTQNPYQASLGELILVPGSVGPDVFVTKLGSSGDALIYSTYIGGGHDDRGAAIAVDANGHAYVTGVSYGANYPVKNPYQYHQGNEDVIVTKLSIAGDSLIYSTFIGGFEGIMSDVGTDIAVDDAGYIYVAGYTNSTNFPVFKPFQKNIAGATDNFVIKLTPSGQSCVYSTYLGGIADEYEVGLAVANTGRVYVSGTTRSFDFPELGPFPVSVGGGVFDAFTTKLSDYLCADADGSLDVNISDALFLIGYTFGDGSTPSPLLSGDANCDSSLDISDVVYLIAYIFLNGPAPCPTC